MQSIEAMFYATQLNSYINYTRLMNTNDVNLTNVLVYKCVQQLQCCRETNRFH
ncbi:Uncharacterized protein APZ42_009981 [Daphnia magna]|uniref:Uncharacterized protein n=1 Tax=Daphnia magna TaxID=35525 RepID=A0A164DMY2_9CRUS|nr:Uncharacterized protein APZ42_009981 [Daphnia magna]